MASTSQEPKGDAHAYPWFFPSEGNGTGETNDASSVRGQAGEAGADPEGELTRSGPSSHGRPHSPLKANVPGNHLRLRVVEVLGWSAFAAAGTAELASRPGPFPGLQVGLMAGVWLAVSAAVWFLPTVAKH